MSLSLRHVLLQLALVAAGGGLGAIGRYAVSEWLGGTGQGLLPWGTLVANLAGSFLMGIVVGYVDRKAISNRLRLFLAVGLLGSFTTFSLFSYENLELLRDGRMIALIANASVQTGAGVGAAAIGYLAATYRDISRSS